ncbi:N-alpha-acetyltransferase 35, NatC auxiliary subunit [Hypsibius exemplaris]|uniref:Protein MAK10 homolog n=1 Tax=Hypsibius exemplaris TaxID=2072580 RepID=A0A1W0WJV8_HYPEX|nr:N-alpha-acetyltransferase 35, NatC auxiliary subunit [Hypsibius exemplaris]
MSPFPGGFSDLSGSSQQKPYTGHTLDWGRRVQKGMRWCCHLTLRCSGGGDNWANGRGFRGERGEKALAEKMMNGFGHGHNMEEEEVEEEEDYAERRRLESSAHHIYNWKNVHQDLHGWASELDVGELITIPNFSLYDAMSAIELCDVKMDIGLLLKDRKIKSFEEGMERGSLKMDNFLAVEYLAVMERSLANLILWIEGHCLAQTVFTMLYLHKPQQVPDELIRTYCWSLLALCEYVRQIMLDGYVVEEEDFQVTSLALPPSSNADAPTAAALLKSVKSCEETSSKQARKHRSSFKETSLADDDLQSQQWNALAMRFRFLRTLLQFFGSFALRSESFFAEAPQLIDLLEATIEKILAGYKLSEEQFRAAPGFESLVNLHLLPPSFPRHTPATVDGKSFDFFRSLSHQLRIVVSARDRLKTIEGFLFYLRTDGVLLDSALTRSMMQIVIGASLVLKRCSGDAPGKWELISTSDFIADSLRAFSNPPVLMSGFAQYEHHGQMKEYIETFLRSCIASTSVVLRNYGLNKARQRDSLAACLVDLFALQDDAEKFDEYFNAQLAELKLTGLNHTFCFGSWTLTTMLNAMADFLFCGLELQLYANSELHFVYWYLYDVLLHCEVQTISRAESATRENELAWQILHEVNLRGNKKAGGSKKKQNGRTKGSSESVPRPHVLYLARAQTLHHFCGALHYALLALQWQEKIKRPDQSLDCEEFRYYHRLMPFQERNAPAFVDYEQYQQVKSVMARNHVLFVGSSSGENSLDSVSDAYLKSSFNFQQADRHLVLWAKGGEKAILSKLCKRNDVIVRILATGRNCKAVAINFDLHPWFPSLSLL